MFLLCFHLLDRCSPGDTRYPRYTTPCLLLSREQIHNSIKKFHQQVQPTGATLIYDLPTQSHRRAPRAAFTEPRSGLWRLQA
ncbi:hypothetical protein INR49_017824 [Caranx melampygus]|nr:hypothetical protein INR49_017824 [Caranx melampygus]